MEFKHMLDVNRHLGAAFNKGKFPSSVSGGNTA